MTSYTSDARPITAALQHVEPGQRAWTWQDPRRLLQLALAGVWLLDAILQFQASMFTKGFAHMLGASAAGNPAFIADPISMSARLIVQHPAATNGVFATVQLLLALGIAWRPTLRFALASSVIWSVAVWWLGEGLGGVLAGTASPVNGAPGPVVLYALLAVLLWPADRDRGASFAAGRFVGPSAAKALWFVLWGSLAVFALLPATTAPGALAGMLSDAGSGQPGWLAALDSHLAAFLSSGGGMPAVVLAAALGVVAVGVYVPRTAVRAVLVLAIVISAVLGLAQGLGGIFTGGGTDPGSGPLLALLALAYWPLRLPDDPASSPPGRSA